MRCPPSAVTDVNNLFGVYEISEALAARGVQPIVGCLLSVDLDEAASPVAGMMTRARPPDLALLVQNEMGYRNLAKLLERGLSRRRAGRLAACQSGCARRPCRRSDRADGRAGRSAQSAYRGRPAGRGVGTARPAESDVWRPALCRVAASRSAGRTRRGRASDRSRL